MSMFRAKRLDLGCFINARVIRDHTKRKVYEQFEPERYARITKFIKTLVNLLSVKHNRLICFYLFLGYRQALRYAIRNTSLPQRVRAQAQLQLAQMHAYTRSTQIKNRCVAGGIARGVFRDFRLGRVCCFSLFLLRSGIRIGVRVAG